MTKAIYQLNPGTIIGADFQIVGKLAEGGMGIVFKAEQLSTRKTRAVKVMHPTLVTDERMRTRFLQEAWAVSKLESDHAVEVVAAGIDENTKMPWLAMELLKGGTLDQYMDEHKMLNRQSMRELARQLRHVLAQAHKQGLVHRDLKPENLFMCKPRTMGVQFTLKVLDFGIAKFLQESRSLKNSQAMGSPLWMAPEQWNQSTEIGPSADVWSLGLVFFYAMTGRVYWKTASGKDVAQLVVEVVTSTLEPASTRAKQQGSDVDLPKTFDEWFERCIKREPLERFANADEALQAFEKALTGIDHSGDSHSAVLSELENTEKDRDFVTQPTIVQLDPTPTIHQVGSLPVLAQRSKPTQVDMWSSIAEPAWRESDVVRVALALGPVLAELLAVTPMLVGLSDQWRIGKLHAKLSAGSNPSVAAAENAIRETSAKLGFKDPVLYYRENQKEPIRVEPTQPLSFVLGPALSQLKPREVVMLGSCVAAVQRPELLLRAFVTDITELKRTIAAAVEIVRGRTPRGRAALLLTDLREKLEMRPDVAVCLEDHGAGCTESAIAHWISGVDETLLRIGLLTVHYYDGAETVLNHWPFQRSAQLDNPLESLRAWLLAKTFDDIQRTWQSG